MHSAWDHDCTLNDRFGKPSCMTEFEQEIREDERERCRAAVLDHFKVAPLAAEPILRRIG